MKDNPLNDLADELRTFASERDWDKFHSPKNLVLALCGEVGELAEQFQWLTEAQSCAPEEQHLNAIKDEIADVQLYLVRLADKLGIDIYKECLRKIGENGRKYPVEKSRGTATKYDRL